MNYGLQVTALNSIRSVLARHPRVRAAVIFGSRAVGREQMRSDIDLELEGDLHCLDAEGISLELDDLPLPFHFDIHIANEVRDRALREHIDRVGKNLYRSDPVGHPETPFVGSANSGRQSRPS